MRLVIDTNVFFAAMVSDGLCQRVIRKHVIHHHLVTSKILLDELAEKIRVKLHADPDEVPLYAAYVTRANLVIPKPLGRQVSRDADDDAVLATALAGDADAIITGDKDLLVLKKFRGIPILSPRQFLGLVEPGG